MTPEEIEERAIWEAGQHQRDIDAVAAARHAAYTAPGGSDAVFMKYQRDEATKQDWLDAKAAIDALYPYPQSTES